MASTEQPTPAAQIDFGDGTCAICLELPQNKSQTPCGHVFCYQCLTNWCQIKIECPVCQQSFTSFKHSFQSPDDYQVHTPTPPVVPVKRIESTWMLVKFSSCTTQQKSSYGISKPTMHSLPRAHFCSFHWNPPIIVALSDYFQSLSIHYHKRNMLVLFLLFIRFF